MDVECPKGGRHEFFWDDSPELYICKCGNALETGEAQDYINAALQLTADEAESIRMDDRTPEDSMADMRLAAYAAAWRET